MNKKFKIFNKGFTLIELLAVIVVLAVILVIAVPRVLNVIEESDKESFRITAENLIKGAKDRLIYDMEDTIEEKTYTIEEGNFVGDSIPITGTLPNSGTIQVTREGDTSIAISNDKWCARKTKYEQNIIVSKDPDCILYIPEVVPESCFTRTNDGTSVTITGYDSSCSKNPIITNTLDGFPVRIIGGFTFVGNQLTSVILPNSLLEIGEMAFSHNQFTSVTIPNSVTTIEGSAFSNNQLTSVTISNIVTTIEEFAFSNNQLTNVTIPLSVTKIGGGVFNNNLFPDNIAFIYKINNDGSNDITTIVSYGGARKDVVIPNSVNNIGEYTFYKTELTSVTIPNSVTTIENFAFYTNQLTSVTIPNSVTNIGDFAFANNQLTSVTIPDGLQKINKSIFYWNQLTNITIPNSVTSIGEIAFGNNNLTSVTIPSSVTNVDDFAFTQNQLTSVTIPSNVTTKTYSISSTFYNTYNPQKQSGTYTAPSQAGVWTKQP